VAGAFNLKLYYSYTKKPKIIWQLLVAALYFFTSDKFILQRLLNSFCLGMYFELPIDILDMSTHRFFIHKQLFGYCAIAFAFGE
jgi:hypothetical protein